ncbi:2,2-dialkylglycine decarboxylase [Vibrio thalassae]|uniref:2,2-dialkylglycine decarboxylase n=1 Tax=Vibrio thalassae TaxID=1243014 RepID=A0A240EFA8_9VIBR|nr:2,2-dialkylglycine decarboxylase [Vibrio thalassae]
MLITAIAAALPVCPASSIFSTATDAGMVLVEYKNTTADVVVKALINKYIAISNTAGKQQGSETLKNSLYCGSLTEAAVASISAGNCFRAVKARLDTMKQQYPVIGDVRGIGLLWGVELVKSHVTKARAFDEAEQVLYQCLNHGLSFKVSQGNVIQLSPPLVITREELTTALDIFEQAITKVCKDFNYV